MGKPYLFYNMGTYTWLNTENPKLTVVNHKDYIPEEYLPTFSSHPIELNLHRIKGLSEQFVYFNDDTFIINAMQPEDFFKKGLPYRILYILKKDAPSGTPSFF